jgi:hypothetical protein
MPEEPKTQSWWQTLPGIFTAMAGIITAIAGLVVALYQAGFFQHNRPETIPAASAPLTTTSRSHADVAGTDAQPASRTSPGPLALPSKSVNLFASENGGYVIVASSDEWVGTIDGKEGTNYINGVTSQPEAVYAFKDEKPATLDMFTLLIPGTSDYNVKQFELFAGNDSPTGVFESIGKFQTQNVKLFKTPYQEFKFSPVKAKYLKIKLLSTYGPSSANVPEVQIFGRMEKK